MAGRRERCGVGRGVGDKKKRRSGENSTSFTYVNFNLMGGNLTADGIYC